MIRSVKSGEHKTLSLQDYEADAKFAAIIADLKQEAAQLKPKLAGRTIWMVNSTAEGGGVAEMMPRMMVLMNQLGVTVRWSVITTEDQAFFRLTKRLHNMIHGSPGDGQGLSAADARVYEAVNRSNAASFKQDIRPNDIVVIHDPQPLPLGQMLHQELGVKTVWRCHIGLDTRTETTRAVWKFLAPYLSTYDKAIFSVPEYIPSYLADRASIICPAIDPLSHKNRELSSNKMVGILCNSGLQKAYHPVATPNFAHRCKRLQPNGKFRIAGEFGLLFRPIVLQISRWDRLKGWLPLLDGFVRMKQRHQRAPRQSDDPRYGHRIDLSRLVLAGPDPSSVADDPEGLEAFEEICEAYKKLDPQMQKEVAILVLPMDSRKENALIVNALQRCAGVVVQNSLREGFGLTVTEAMWKHVPLLGTRACGIQMQVRDQVDGILTENAEDADEIATHLLDLLGDPLRCDAMGRSGQRRVYDEFLVFTQIRKYLRLLSDMV